MAYSVTIPPLVVRNWLNKAEKQVITGSVWGRFSNRVEANTQLPNDGSMEVPKTVIASYGGSFSKGSMAVVIPSIDKLQKEGQGGHQPVEGNEESPELRYSKVHYNVQRKGITIEDGTVDGRATQAYGLVAQGASLMADYFTELSDFNYSKAMCQGGDQYLTEARFWGGGTFANPLVTETYHPNILFPGVNGLDPENATNGMPAWNAVQAQYVQNIQTRVSTLTAAGTVFTKNTLDKIGWFASRNTAKLGMSMGGQTVDWVLLISEVQADQLLSDTTAGNWTQLFKDAGARGNENKAITGVIGIYRNILVIVNPRQPLFNTEAGSGLNPFQYIKPWADERVPATKAYVQGTGSSGTMEVAMLLGRTALGQSIVERLNFHYQYKDYQFTNGTEARRTEGIQRMDFYRNGNLAGVPDLAVRPSNWSSFLYLTGTPLISF